MAFLSVWLNFFLLISVHEVAKRASASGLIGNTYDEYGIRQALSLKLHQSRSVARVADKAIKFLMTGAKEVPTGSPRYRKFVKLGSGFDAVTDFEATNPVFLDKRAFTTDGYIDGVKFTLKMKDKSQGRNPSIMITDDPYRKLPIKIVYQETLD